MLKSQMIHNSLSYPVVYLVSINSLELHLLGLLHDFLNILPGCKFLFHFSFLIIYSCFGSLNCFNPARTYFNCPSYLTYHNISFVIIDSTMFYLPVPTFLPFPVSCHVYAGWY